MPGCQTSIVDTAQHYSYSAAMQHRSCSRRWQMRTLPRRMRAQLLLSGYVSALADGTVEARVGLYQRGVMILPLCWLEVVAIRVLRRQRVWQELPLQ